MRNFASEGGVALAEDAQGDEGGAEVFGLVFASEREVERTTAGEAGFEDFNDLSAVGVRFTIADFEFAGDAPGNDCRVRGSGG